MATVTARLAARVHVRKLFLLYVTRGEIGIGLSHVQSVWLTEGN